MTPLKYPQSTRLDKTFDSVLNWIKIAENWIYRATKVINEIISTLGEITDFLPPDTEPTEGSDKVVISGGVYNSIHSIHTELADKVDKIDGKELSSNDFTDEYLNLIETHQENINDLSVNKTFYNEDSGNYDPFLGYFRVYRIQGTLQKVACIYVGPYTIYLLRSAQGVISLEKVLYLDKLIFNL